MFGFRSGQSGYVLVHDEFELEFMFIKNETQIKGMRERDSGFGFKLYLDSSCEKGEWIWVLIAFGFKTSERGWVSQRKGNGVNINFHTHIVCYLIQT